MFNLNRSMKGKSKQNLHREFSYRTNNVADVAVIHSEAFF